MVACFYEPGEEELIHMTGSSRDKRGLCNHHRCRFAHFAKVTAEEADMRPAICRNDELLYFTILGPTSYARKISKCSHLRGS
jgi:hypothetical protein